MYDLLWVIGVVTLFFIFELPETASPLLLKYKTAFNMSALSQLQSNIFYFAAPSASAASPEPKFALPV